MTKLKELREKCKEALEPLRHKSPYQCPAEQADSNGTAVHKQSATKIESRVLYTEDENKERGNWSGRLDFLLSMLGWSVGLGNVWRFPYQAYRNGGGVFLIPYLLTLFSLLISPTAIGVPMFFMEISMAQFTSQGTLHCWGMAPLFKGLGFGMMLVTVMTTIYYNVIIGYSLIYLFTSFTSYLPWSDCNNPWNTIGCSHLVPLVNCSSFTDAIDYPNGTCYNGTELQGVWSVSVFENMTGIRRESPSEQYYNKEVLGISPGIDHFGSLQWKVSLAFLGAWALVYVCVCNGIKSSGKVVYVTATFPYLVLFILLIRACMLPGSADGIYWYINPQWEKLAGAKVWRDGATQIFYSMGMGWGGLQALASYNRFHNNCFRDSLIVSMGTCMTSIFAGFVVFAFLGAMAHNMDTTIENVAASGPGLAFIVYPEAFTFMPAPVVWSILFFVMILTVGLDTQFVMVETIITCVLDEIPYLRKKKALTILGVCIVEFLVGLPITSSAGIYILLLIDNFASWVGLPILVLIETALISYLYGADRFCNDISVMLGKMPWKWYFKINWMFIAPVLIIFVLIYPLVDYSRFSYGAHYVYPIWAESIGWLFTLSPVFFVVGFMVYSIVITPDGTVIERVRKLCKPTKKWGPYLAKHRMLIDYVDGFVVDIHQDSSINLINVMQSDDNVADFNITKTALCDTRSPINDDKSATNNGITTVTDNTNNPEPPNVPVEVPLHTPVDV